MPRRQRWEGLLRNLREHRGATLTRMLRLTGAALAAYLVARVTLTEPRPVLAPLTALLIVQVTLVGTLADTTRRILSVLAGVTIAVVFAAFVGFDWWSLTLLVAAAIVVGQLLRLGPHLLEVPISAMLVLAVGGSEAAALGRFTETVIGAAAGLLVNVIFPPAVQTRSAGEAVERYAHQMAALLDRVADELRRPVVADQVDGWLGESRRLADTTPQLDRVLARAAESRRLNPRAVASVNSAPDLRSGLDTLEHCAVALRGLYRSLSDRVHEQPDLVPLDAGDASGVLADLLADLGTAFREFGTMVRAEAEQDAGSRPGKPRASRSRPDGLGPALDSAREARARLSDLLLVDARDSPRVWALHGGVLANVDRVLRELDVPERERERARDRAGLDAAASRAAATARRLRTATRAAARNSRQLRAGRPIRRGHRHWR